MKSTIYLFKWSPKDWTQKKTHVKWCLIIKLVKKMSLNLVLTSNHHSLRNLEKRKREKISRATFSGQYMIQPGYHFDGYHLVVQTNQAHWKGTLPNHFSSLILIQNHTFHQKRIIKPLSILVASLIITFILFSLHSYEYNFNFWLLLNTILC